MSRIFTVDRWTPIAFDMLDDHLRAAFVAYPRTLARIIHGVGEVPRQRHVHPSRTCWRMPNGRPSTHMLVCTHQHHVANLLVTEIAIDLFAVITDAVFRSDLQQFVLAVVASTADPTVWSSQGRWSSTGRAFSLAGSKDTSSGRHGWCNLLRLHQPHSLGVPYTSIIPLARG